MLCARLLVSTLSLLATSQFASTAKDSYLEHQHPQEHQLHVQVPILAALHAFLILAVNQLYVPHVLPGTMFPRQQLNA